MAPSFVLELYYEMESQVVLATAIREAHIRLVAFLAPHLLLDVRTLKANAIIRSIGKIDGRPFDVPNQSPSSPQCQALLITAEEIGYMGLAGPGKGCLRESALRNKMKLGSDPADVSVHEWLHTLEGSWIGGRQIPSPHSNSQYERFASPSGYDSDGDGTWHSWYRHILRPHPSEWE